MWTAIFPSFPNSPLTGLTFLFALHCDIKPQCKSAISSHQDGWVCWWICVPPCHAFVHTCPRRTLKWYSRSAAKISQGSHLPKISLFFFQMKTLFCLTSRAHHDWVSAPLFNLDHTRFPLMGCYEPQYPTNTDSTVQFYLCVLVFCHFLCEEINNYLSQKLYSRVP